ncbi:MAG: hypothetical protein ACKOCB_11005 [Planctomycetia bacterium]
MATTAEPAPGGTPPGRRTRLAWPWLFGVVFLLLAASSAYFLVQGVPLARRMDASRSSLRAEGEQATRARVLVRALPQGGEVRARAVAPAAPGAPWRVEVQWTAEPGALVPTVDGEALVEVLIPARVDEVEVWDLRGGITPERMRLQRTDGTR